MAEYPAVKKSETVNVAIAPLAQPLTYLPPAGLSPAELHFCQVTVPLGSRHVTGYVLPKTADENGNIELARLRRIKGETPIVPCFNAELLEFYTWVASYYRSSLATVLDTAIPTPLPPRMTKSVTLCHPDYDPAAVRGPRQKEILLALRQAEDILDYQVLLQRYRGAAGTVRRLAAAGLVAVTQQELSETLSEPAQPEWAKRSVQLSCEQTECLEQIRSAAQAPQFRSFLLHGATGSGKTEVYIEAVKELLARQQGALIIVPEIALTPQLIDRFAARLAAEIAVLHSGINKRQRWLAWRKLLAGEVRVAIGARSAIFAPVPNLGLIIVDEEHDSSFKQSDGLRYHARDLAVIRAKLKCCPVVLGSATPALESYQNSRVNKYHYLELPARHQSGAGFTIEVVDLNKCRRKDMASDHVSQTLFQALQQVIDRGQQAFVLYNRRGFATYLQCDRCEQVLYCPNCSVTFTYHQQSHRLCCHYCNLSVLPPELCLSCASSPSSDPPGRLVLRGAGTERVLSELQELFPQTSIDRLDRDAATAAGSRRIIEQVRSGKTTILVGTQMLAKGHDLPKVTLVGVVDCDVGLHLPDFRAGEKVFQLLTQAGGRAGRGAEPGLVILQTRVPDHHSLRCTLKKDYLGFAAQELRSRQALQYPPFSRLLRIIAAAPERDQAAATLNQLAEQIRLKAQPGKLLLLGPAPAPLEKIKTEYRWHLLIKARQVLLLQELIKQLKGAKPPRRVKVIFDLDPYDLL